MALFGRRDKPPAAALAGLEHGERVLSFADTDHDAVVLATPRGVWWPDPDGPRLIGWQHVDKAVWRDGVLSIVEADIVDDVLLVDRPAVAVGLRRPRDLPPVLRQRIEHNIVHREVVSVPGGAVRFVGRREPGKDGVVWWARLERGTRDTPVVRSAIRARLAILRADRS